MLRSTPHPPVSSATLQTSNNINLGNLSLFTVKPDVRIEDALVPACEYLHCAAATAYEAAENSTQEFRPLARSVVHQLEAARVLVDASVASLEKQRKAT